MRSQPMVVLPISLFLIAAFMSLGFGLTSGVSAQEAPRLRLIRVDAELLAYATGSLVYPRSGSWFVGGEAGLGWGGYLPRFSRFVHVGALLTKVGSRSDLDIGLELGYGELNQHCTGDCLPDPRGYGAMKAGIAYGWKRVRFGTRLLLGWTEGEGFVAWEPLFLRFRF